MCVEEEAVEEAEAAVDHDLKTRSSYNDVGKKQGK